MDIKELFHCCKSGNLNRIKYLIENKDIDVNVRDNFDSTPLYYACLCGYTNIVHYLLRYGAKCEANTFDGERCIYGSLTLEIRNILRDHKVITLKLAKRNDYDEFMRKAFEFGEYSDVTFSVHKEIFNVHKCILSSRCEYFYEMFHNKWKNRKIITLNNVKVRPYAFRILMQYLYTGRLESQFEQIEDVKVLIRQCKMYYLLEQIKNATAKILSFERLKQKRTNITTVVIESDTNLPDFSVLFNDSIPLKFKTWVNGSELPFLPCFEDIFSDVIFNVENEIFKSHRIFFSRSDYFKAFINFCELQQQMDNNVIVIPLKDISIDAFIGLLSFLYQNHVEFDMNNIYELLIASDFYLLPGLKTQCANYLGQHLNADNVMSIIRSARMFHLPKLESRCNEFIAKNLEKMINDPEFHKLIMEDASDVKERQETDTIDIIDDIRYYIMSNVQTYSAISESKDKLEMIDQLLEELDLEA